MGMSALTSWDLMIGGRTKKPTSTYIRNAAPAHHRRLYQRDCLKAWKAGIWICM